MLARRLEKRNTKARMRKEKVIDLHIPEMMHSTIKIRTFRWNTGILLLCAEKMDAVRKCGIEISDN